MPRIISVNRKYWPALSSALSLLSCHRRGRGRRKPDGGGPDEMACWMGVVEKALAVIVADDRRGTWWRRVALQTR